MVSLAEKQALFQARASAQVLLRFHTTSKELCGELGRKLMGTFTSLVPMQTVPTSGFQLLAVCKNEGRRPGRFSHMQVDRGWMEGSLGTVGVSRERGV